MKMLNKNNQPYSILKIEFVSFIVVEHVSFWSWWLRLAERILLLLSSVVRIQCNKTEVNSVQKSHQNGLNYFLGTRIVSMRRKSLLFQRVYILIQYPCILALMTQINTMQYFFAFAEIWFYPLVVTFQIPSMIMNLLLSGYNCTKL